MNIDIRTPKGARWDCRGCGTCCRLYDLGPVEPEVIRGLEEARIGDLWEPAATGFYETRRAPDGREFFFLRRVHDACVFLRPDNLCAVHGLLGGDKKPGFCREFPYHFVDGPRGTTGIVRSSCAGFHYSATDGKPIADEVAEVARLPRVAPRRRFAPGEVPVLPDAVVPIGTWLDWEDEVVAALDDRVDANALTPMVVARDLLLTRLGRPIPAPDPQRARMAAGAVLEAMRRVLDLAVNDADADPARRAFAVESQRMTSSALATLGRPPVLAPDARAWWNLVVRSFLIGKSFAGYGTVAGGLGALCIGAMAVGALGAAGPDGIPANEAGPIVVRWTKLTDNSVMLGLLRKASPALIDVFLASGAPR